MMLSAPASHGAGVRRAEDRRAARRLRRSRRSPHRRRRPQGPRPGAAGPRRARPEPRARVRLRRRQLRLRRRLEPRRAAGDHPRHALPRPPLGRHRRLPARRRRARALARADERRVDPARLRRRRLVGRVPAQPARQREDARREVGARPNRARPLPHARRAQRRHRLRRAPDGGHAAGGGGKDRRSGRRSAHVRMAPRAADRSYGQRPLVRIRLRDARRRRPPRALTSGGARPRPSGT